MSLRSAAEVWTLLRTYLREDEVGNAADDLVGELLEHGYELDDIEYEFDGHDEIINSVRFYRDETTEEHEEHDEYEDEEEDEWN